MAPTNNITVREATPEDREEIWVWWNDPLTRAMMANNAAVPWEDHCAWFEAVSKDKDRVLCMGLSGEEKIGVIRFDLRWPQIFEVSINLKPEARGKGCAVPFMHAAIDHLLRTREVTKLLAGCKKINLASKNTFIKSGFEFKVPPQDHPTLRTFNPETEIYCEKIFDQR